MTPTEATVRQQKDDATLTLLGKLTLIYWRPDFTPAQARELYAQYLDDLREWPFTEIKHAIEKYRQDPENKFFPTPGQIVGLIKAVPAWDVISSNAHLSNLRKQAREEIEGMVQTASSLEQNSGPKYLRENLLGI